jgi:hypothetical protein
MKISIGNDANRSDGGVKLLIHIESNYEERPCDFKQDIYTYISCLKEYTYIYYDINILMNVRNMDTTTNVEKDYYSLFSGNSFIRNLSSKQVTTPTPLISSIVLHYVCHPPSSQLPTNHSQPCSLYIQVPY